MRMGKIKAKFVYKFAQDKLKASKFDADFALSFLRFNALKFDIDTTNRRNLRALRAGVSIEFDKTHADKPGLIRDVNLCEIYANKQGLNFKYRIDKFYAIPKRQDLKQTAQSPHGLPKGQI